MIYHEYVIIGAGIAGCCAAHFLKNDDILLMDRFDNVASFASGTAGGFLSPLLGKPNKFKELITKSLNYAVEFYNQIDSNLIVQNGVLRMPQNEEDKKKFDIYKEHLDFPCDIRDEGFFFEIGSQVYSQKMCQKLTENITKKLNYDIKHIKKIDGFWIINDEIKCKNLILTTGCDTRLLDEDYLNIRAVWGQRIDVSTTTCIDINYHKECSISTSKELLDNKTNLISIGATHHRFEASKEDIYKAYENPTNENLSTIGYTEKLYNMDTEELLRKANNIRTLDNIKVLKKYFAPRASSIDYFPMIGNIIDSKKTIEEFPYLLNGTHVRSERFKRYENLYLINGVGGRGFVLSPYLAKSLIDFIKNGNEIEEEIRVDRLFKRWVRKIK